MSACTLDPQRHQRPLGHNAKANVELPDSAVCRALQSCFKTSSGYGARSHPRAKQHVAIGRKCADQSAASAFRNIDADSARAVRIIIYQRCIASDKCCETWLVAFFFSCTLSCFTSSVSASCSRFKHPLIQRIFSLQIHNSALTTVERW